ncbi:hypothetical protein L596_001614 [Steinernema carpocapsae]|uniref:Copper transport protein n=1 Tax=Steinernema carpocapsae TaxID=34508 RepID=A0A4U8UM93_STECR|nr:hypothetical protein L596_001614 [Steinernema carpocapsae]
MFEDLKELLIASTSAPSKLSPCLPNATVYEQCRSMYNQTIHFTEKEIILFKFWKTGKLSGMAISVFIIFLLCLLHEAIKGLRLFVAKMHYENLQEQRMNRAVAGRSPSIGSNDTLLFAPILKAASSAFTVYRISQAALYGTQMVLAYALILVVSTFNGSLILAVVVGEAVGYFVFIGSPSFEEGAGC